MNIVATAPNKAVMRNNFRAICMVASKESSFFCSLAQATSFTIERFNPKLENCCKVFDAVANKEDIPIPSGPNSTATILPRSKFIKILNT